MARTLAQHKDIITSFFISIPEIIATYSLAIGLSYAQQFSLGGIEDSIFNTIAFATWSLETQWEIFKQEITAEMALQRAHTKDWYRNKALGFLLGVPVIAGTDQFDTTGMTDEEIEAAKVIKQAATVKLISANGYGILRIKVATADENGILQPVPTPAFNACKAYMEITADAGTQVQITTGVADQLKAVIDVYFDNLVLDPQGQRLDGSNNTPVQDAITGFLRSISFNGVLNIKELEAAITAVEGVKYANVTEAASKYGAYTYEQTGIANVGPINVFRVADSGYFVMDDLQLNWLEYEQ